MSNKIAKAQGTERVERHDNPAPSGVQSHPNVVNGCPCGGTQRFCKECGQYVCEKENCGHLEVTT